MPRRDAGAIAPGARGVETLLKGKQCGELGFAEPALAHEHLSQSFFRRLLFGESASELRSRKPARFEQQFADRFSGAGCGIQYIVEACPLRANSLDSWPLFRTQLRAVQHAVHRPADLRFAVGGSMLVLVVRCIAHAVILVGYNHVRALSRWPGPEPETPGRRSDARRRFMALNRGTQSGSFLASRRMRALCTEDSKNHAP